MERRSSTSQTPSGASQQPSTGNTPQPQANASSSKRRRGPGVVTPNACNECRKKRAKCDGNKPCGRCKSQNDVACVYEIPIRQSKEELRQEIESLRQRQRSSDVVFENLQHPDLWEEVLRRLRDGQSVEAISEWLSGKLPSGAGSALPRLGDREAAAFEDHSTEPPGTEPSSGLSTTPREPWQRSPWHESSHSQAGSTRSNSFPDVLGWQRESMGPSHSRSGSWTDSMHLGQMSAAMPRSRGPEQIPTQVDETGLAVPASMWTSITDDANLVQHLLTLYFCWEYPTFASLSREHFLPDFRAGRRRYCSDILVNALLALGCRFSAHPMSRANPVDPYSSGDHFFRETKRLLNQETDLHSLTTIQALGIMSIREASCGRDSESWYYAGQSIRLAIEMGLHLVRDEGDEHELAVQAATFWGAFALDCAWSMTTGSLPQCSRLPRLPHKPAIVDDIESSLWMPYTDDGTPLQRSYEQPSNVRSVYKSFCELSELVHRALYVLHCPGKPLTARDLLSIYTQYLNWYDQIPDVLRLGLNFTPAVLFAHMYYHFAILLLFRPLIKLRIVGSKVLPRDVCSQAADAIQGLLTSYSQLYTLQRTPSFVPYFVLTSTVMHLAIGTTTAKTDRSEDKPDEAKSAAIQDSKSREILQQGIKDLSQMVPCHRFAERALNILRYLAKKWCIDVDIGNDDNLDADVYDSLVRPRTGSLNFFTTNFDMRDFICRWATGGPDTTNISSTTIQTMAEQTANPLFWPFPLQGKPILPAGKELEDAGFALLQQ